MPTALLIDLKRCFRGKKGCVIFMKKPIFTGSGVALVTPFTNDGVNYPKLEELIEFHIAHKTDALIICGTTGEGSTMTMEEHEEVLRFCVEKAKGRVPMIAGTGSNDTSSAIRLSKYAEEVGYDGLLMVTPYYNKATQKGLCEHYGKIAENTKLPIILYNVPSRTGVSISLDTLKFLDEKYENINAIKEASGDVAFAARIKAHTNLVIYSGNDDITLPLMSLGCQGVISVIANILPEETHNICELFEKGEIEEAKSLYLGMLDLMDAMFYEVNPIPVKTAMNLLGFDVGILRLPLCEMEEKDLERLKKALKNYGILK